MANVEQVREAASEFLKKVINTSDVKIIKVSKNGNNWKVEAEVYEDSSFIKSLGLPTRVKDRNVYVVAVHDNLEIESYERKEESRKTA